MSRIGFLFDLDGVVYKDDEPIADAVVFLKSMVGVPHLFLTNNSFVTPKEIVERLCRFGLGAIDRDLILTSAQATASWLAQQQAHFSYYAVGGEGLQDALAERGTPSDNGADFVVVGEGPGIDYDSITCALALLRRESNPARLIGTNPDQNIDAVINGKPALRPGGGALIAPFEVAAGMKPIFIGKPYPTMYIEGVRRLGVQPAKCCMIGDRPDTDIIGAARLGLTTVLVRTGRFAPEDPWPEDWPGDVPKPDYDVNSLSDLDLDSLRRRLEGSR